VRSRAIPRPAGWTRRGAGAHDVIVTSGSDEPVGLDELARRWQAAEEKLYPVVLVRPEAYASAVTLVRAVVDRLGGIGSVDELAAAFGTSAQLVADVVRDTGVSTEGVDLGLIAGAAFNIRHRDLRAAGQREQAKQRIREAAAASQDWVVLFETGRPDLAPLAPYRRLEMRRTDGLGMHVSVSPDPSTGGPVFAVEVVQLDPATGDWVHDAEPVTGAQTYPTRDEWESAIATLRRTGKLPSHFS
jgi:hypothetical protein